jgi:hypothetical protein
MGPALSPGTPPAEAAAWIEGLVGGGPGGGLLLVHDERLLGLVDAPFGCSRAPSPCVTSCRVSGGTGG